MKIDRLIGILSILLQQKKVTAPYLAEKFEVSRRTINRDIEHLCKAGIPVVTTQGADGGISIMEGYRVDRTLLTSADMQAILTGLRSLDSVSGTNRYQQLMEKLSVGTSGILPSNQHILIDLSSWYKSSLAPKIELIQNAIDQKKRIAFSYFSPSGESKRSIEPYLLLFQWASWYVWGYCTTRKDYRLFKLNRMLELELTEQTFSPRDLPDFTMENKNIFPARILATVSFTPSFKWRLIEEYGPQSYEEQEDGTLLFHSGFTDRESLFSWLLSFGDQVTLLKPESLQREFTDFVQEILKKYAL